MEKFQRILAHPLFLEELDKISSIEKDRVFCDRVILQEKVKFPPKILPENLKKLPSSDVIVIESDANAKNSVFCSNGSCGRALFEKIDTKKAAYNFGIYHQKTKN